ncbi:DUF6777 domain-containing protein [Streptomyces sp. FIT100]|uniref:DUF6777 domain-containing protein n=1 Tax=Streptomyces sp. FIT100 TaxID=2837956 RepID=UPI0021C81CF6|nr:DUF6777 domain-containing protein [Streptomyces sp. FIT100]UUN26976.1 primosomal protein [Streptomyces sp. FIT100]
MSAGAALAVVMAVVLAYPLVGGGRGGGEVFLQTASAAGADPFTASTATEADSAEADAAGDRSSVPGVSAPGGSGGGTLQVNGAHPGLYGGTQNVTSCDVEKQIRYLTENDDKGKVFAGVLSVRQSDIPSYLRSLTPVRLGWDTRVTSHGYKNGEATTYQAILQTGTAVLVDGHGVPRVRCACGNPLTPPVAVEGKPTYTGDRWTSFQPSGLVAVKPAAQPMKAITVFDKDRKAWFERPSGDLRGSNDRKVPPPESLPSGSPDPVLPSPSPSPSTSAPAEPPPDKGKDEEGEKGTIKDEEKKEEPKKKEEEKEKEQGKEGEPRDSEMRSPERPWSPDGSPSSESTSPEKPKAPEKPSEPEPPQSPERPEPPESPERPEPPESPASPEEPESPEPAQPDSPSPPDSPDSPESPDEPEAPKSPDGPQSPAEPRTPEQRVRPGAPRSPDGPASCGGGEWWRRVVAEVCSRPPGG